MRETGRGGLEEYFVKRVAALGGHRRKVKFIGRKGAPDQLVKMPKWRKAKFVELKKPKGGVLAEIQKREHNRLRKHFGFEVLVAYTKEEVDQSLVGGSNATKNSQ